MFQPRVNPLVHHAIMRLAQQDPVRPKQVHEVLAPQEAIDSVAEDLGVAFVPKPLRVSAFSHCGISHYGLTRVW